MIEENRYRMAGWVAVVTTVLFPLGFGVGLIQSIIAAAKFGYSGISIGPSDGIFIVFTLLLAYVLIKFRDLLNERYNFNDIDTLIIVCIWINIIFQVGGFALKLFLITSGMSNEPIGGLIMAGLLIPFIVIGGILDILIAIKLLRIKEMMSETLRFYTYLTMASGICAVTIIFSFLSLLMIPVSTVLYAMIFFKDSEKVEFV